MMSGQDWAPVVLRKKKPTGGEAKSSAVVNEALRTGDHDTVKKYNASKNKIGTSGTGKNTAKLDRETEELKHDRVSTDLKKAIVQGRCAKKLTQAQLAQMINERPTVIQEYESGKAIPNPQVLSKLSRVLGIPLSKNAKPPKKKK
ncbi:hypothetical protein BSKO_01727 [Bryopsis sp. KO-2023]|nr:hypothetical protein BSKO_01727 [Bryopsis sp. KO-2023]